MRNRRLPGRGLAALALGLVTALALGGPTSPALDAASVATTGIGAVRAGATPPGVTGPEATRSGAAVPGTTRPDEQELGATTLGAAGPGAGGSCGGFAGAHQLAGGDGVTPAAWSGAGLVVPACGPVPGGGPAAAVYPYPGALWTAGYQCVELSERYLYDRFGVTMGIATNGDQVAAHYAAGYPGLFMVIKNGTPHRAPAAGDVLSLSADPGFDTASGGHSAVVQSCAVDAAGNGTVTVVEENASAAGVEVLPVDRWTVRYPGFPFAQWLTTAGLTVTAAHPPLARAGRRYSFTLTATGGSPPYRWRVTSGALPPGLTLSAAGALTGTPGAKTTETEMAGAGTTGTETPGAGTNGSGTTGSGTTATGTPGAGTAGASTGIPGAEAGLGVTVAVTDARGATATAALPLLVRASPPAARTPSPRRMACPVAHQ
jgi:hypothetical protein